MPKITWKIGGQETQKRKKMSGKCSENGKKTQSGRKGLQGEGGSGVNNEIQWEMIAKEMHAHLHREVM